MSYGGSRQDMYLQAGVYVGKILKGVPVTSLPIHRPNRIVFSLNLKCANEMGIVVAPSLMARADEIIE